MERSRKTGYRFGYFFIFVGILFSSIGGASLISTLNFRDRAVPSPARVIGLQQGAPIVRYEYQGLSRELVGSVKTTPPAYQVGESVNVLLNPAFPSEVKLDGWMELYFFASVFGGIGGIFLLVGLAFLFVPHETERPNST